MSTTNPPCTTSKYFANQPRALANTPSRTPSSDAIGESTRPIGPEIPQHIESPLLRLQATELQPSVRNDVTDSQIETNLALSESGTDPPTKRQRDASASGLVGVEDVAGLRKFRNSVKSRGFSNISAPRRSPRILAPIKSEHDQAGTSLASPAEKPSIVLPKRLKFVGRVGGKASTKVGTGSGVKDEDKKVGGESQAKKKRKARPVADPVVYAHLEGVQDLLCEGLDVVFCGINPGVTSATVSHHFAHHSNHFWKALHHSGFTPTLLPPSLDVTLPSNLNLGLTNLIERPSAEASELTAAECRAAVPRLTEKFERDRPKFVCFVGLGIFVSYHHVMSETISPTKKGKKPVLKPGLQNLVLIYPPRGESGKVEKTYLFVTPSTSARVTAYQFPEKVASFTDLRLLRDALLHGIDPNRGMKEVVEVDVGERLNVWRAQGAEGLGGTYSQGSVELNDNMTTGSEVPAVVKTE